MRNQNIIENTGVILCAIDGKILGSCFLFRYPRFVITANHCVRGFDESNILISFPGSRARGARFQAKRFYRHPSADVAVIEFDEPNERDITWTNNEIFDDRGLGVDVLSYGHPEEWSLNGLQNTARLHKGYVQRFLLHKSYLGYEYMAAELSFNCPRGLSGSAVINQSFHGRLYGVVTEGVRKTTEIRSTSDIQEDGKEYRETYIDFVSYGVALWLPSVSGWIDSIVPMPSGDEIRRRSENQHAWFAEEEAAKTSHSQL